jgi:hypothetical protein
MAKNTIKAVPMTIVDSATLTNTYTATITGGLAQSCYLLRIINDSNQDITISYNGTTDADYILQGTGNNIPAIYASTPNGFKAEFAKGTQIYVKGTAGTGNLYIIGYYQPQGV